MVGGVLGVLPSVASAALLIHDLRLGIALGSDATLLVALAAWTVSSLVYLPFVWILRVSPLFVLALPLACLVYSGIALHSAWASVWGRGVPWKGRRYRGLN